MGRYNNEGELRQTAEKRTGQLSEDTWDEVFLESCSPFGAYDDADLRAVLNALADRGYTSESKQKQGGAILGMMTRAELREGEVRDLAKRVRQELFNTSEPPFPDDPDTMRSWIEKERNATPKGPIKKTEVLELLKWGNEGGHKKVCAVVEGSTLDKVRGASQWIAKELGCQEAQVTHYILTGAIPLVAPIQTTKKKLYWPSIHSRGSYSITVNTPDISPEEVKEVAAKLREELWGVKSPRAPREEDIALVKLVLDTPDKKWEDRRRLWNEEHKEKTFRTWGDGKAMKRAFDLAYPRVIRSVIL